MLRMKKSLLSLSVLAIINTAYADHVQTNEPAVYKGFKGEPVAVQHFNGFYVGVGFGDVLTYDNVESSAEATGIHTFFDSDERMTMSNAQDARNWKNSATGILDIGWGHQFKELYYLGIEAFVNYAKHNSSVNNNAGFDYFSNATDTTPVQVNNLATSNESELRSTEYGIDVLPGILLDQTSLLYFRVGAAFNKMELENDNSLSVLYPTTPNTGNTVSNLDAEKHKNITGLRLGVGIEKYICDHVSVSLDYIYTNYGHLRESGTGNVQSLNLSPLEPVSTVNGFTTSAKETMSSNQVYLGLRYRLG